MGAIVDTLYLGESELSIVQGKYPRCHITNQSGTGSTIQKYRVIIPDEEWCDDSYYIFLLDNGIAMSSNSFIGRVESDPKFVERMKARMSEIKENCSGKESLSGS